MKLNKKQKRTATIASMAALLAVVLGMGGQTFAKYVTTTQTGTVQATVAKWGFVANANATNMFPSTSGEKVAATGGSDKLTVKASKGVVAPGTDGSMTLSVTGGADVDASVSFSTGSEWTDVKLTDSYTVGGESKADEYAPVKWTLKEDGAVVDTLENTTLAAIETYFKSASFHYDAGTEAVKLNYVLSWVWDFNGTDKYDTLLGLSMDNTTKVSEETIDSVLHKYSYSTEINFSLSVTITQID